MKKILVLFKFLVFVAIMYYVISILVINFAKDKHLPKSKEEVDYIIVLGAQVYHDKSLSSNLQNRLNKAIEIAKFIDVPIIVSGGQGIDEPISEADAMKDYLVYNKVEENRIYKEDQATSTYENLLYSQEIINKTFKDQNYEVLIITNGFHEYRVSIIANRLGLEYSIYSVESDTKIKSIIREPLAIAKSLLFDR